MKKIIFLIVISTLTVTAFAQTTNNTKPAAQSKEDKKKERNARLNQLMKQYEEGSLIYAKQSAFGFKINTDGWGMFYEHGKYKTIKKTSLWWLELGERKSPKEEKISSGQDIGGGFILVGNPYVYGKENNFYYLKAGVGQQYLIGGKGNKNGVAVSAIYGGGLSLGYLKPYYLNVHDPNTNTDNDIRYSDTVADKFLDPTLINGASGFTKGFTEGKFVPGAYARLALRFDYGRYNELLSALEVGINAEYYSKEMPIMIQNEPKQFFYNAYIAIEFGKRK
ncbi:MAG TPA: hypothetical protein PKM63_15370 [Panacibacter sp.]|nr:hypothetical protein [Panacibacter sp.]HNP45670.1 hypothetical protein [Panacibacter sp.]